MQASDLLMKVLLLARREGALEGEGLHAFAAALQARAERIVEERLARAEARAGDLERDLAWRRQTISGLEDELAWRRESMATLERQLAARSAELMRLGEDRDRASNAHERLLAHHRDVLARTAAELRGLARRPLYAWRSSRAQLDALARSLGGEPK